MDFKFKPRAPVRPRGGKAQISVKPPSKMEECSVKTEPVKMDPVEKDPIKPEPMDIDDADDVTVKMEGGELIWDVDPEMNEEMKDEPVESGPGLHNGRRVVQEIDVYLMPSIDPETKLYLLQYPHRPYWRPYNIEERSSEVRVKHQHKKVEMDLVVDTDCPNFNSNREAHFKINRQTLTSTPGNVAKTNYAIGLLQDNKLYLNPLDAIVQLRPSLKHLDVEEAKIKKSRVDEEMTDAPEAKSDAVAFKVEVKKQETERQQQTRLMSYAYLKQQEDAEPWNALTPHGVDAPLTDAVRRHMKDAIETPVNFNLSRDDYLNRLLPGRPAPQPSTQLSKQPLSKSYLDTLPLDKRIMTVFEKGNVQVITFERIMKMVPAGCSEVDVLAILQKTALLVQGCWVATSRLRYEGPITAIRDYILSLFVKSRYINRETLAELKVTKDVLREILHPLAIQNVKTEAWEFIESTDKTFIKKHGKVVRDQLESWGTAEEGIKAGALAVQKAALGPRITSAIDPTSSLPTVSPLLKTPSSMSPETLAALPGALQEILQKHQVCNLPFIRQCLENLAITKSQEDCNPRETAAAVAAAKAPVADLTLVIGEVATEINGVYFLKQLGDPAVDPFRDVVIALLRIKGPNSGLQKSEINEACKKLSKKAPTAPIYHKIMKELCYTKGATWLLKTGDGRPS